MSHQPQVFPMKRGRASGTTAPRVILSMAAAVAIVIAAAAVAMHYVMVQVPADVARNTRDGAADTAHRMAEGFKNVFNFTPRITVNGTTVVEQANPVVELATVQQDLAVDYSWSQTWLGSTKTMQLRGTYKAKAGFDLRDPFRVAVDASRITASMPAPKLLSMEMTTYKIVADENGWWNSINSQDRENAITGMQAEARMKAAQAGLLEEAKSKLRQELAEAMKGQKITLPLVIEFPGDAAAVQSQEKPLPEK
jgi:Protein of unknown function (DUF4230)